MRFGMAWLQRDRPALDLDRLHGLTAIEQHIAQIGARNGAIGLDFQRLREVMQRVVEQSLFVQHTAEIIVGFKE